MTFKDKYHARNYYLSELRKLKEEEQKTIINFETKKHDLVDKIDMLKDE